MLAEAIVYATIPARDYERAKHFYRDTLGLKVEQEDTEGIKFESGGARLCLYPTHAPEVAGHTLANWDVADIDAEMADLRDRGITFEEYDFPGLKTENGIATDDSGRRAAWFKDSEGNTLGITQD